MSKKGHFNAQDTTLTIQNQRKLRKETNYWRTTWEKQGGGVEYIPVETACAKDSGETSHWGQKSAWRRVDTLDNHWRMRLLSSLMFY